MEWDWRAVDTGKRILESKLKVMSGMGLARGGHRKTYIIIRSKRKVTSVMYSCEKSWTHVPPQGPTAGTV